MALGSKQPDILTKRLALGEVEQPENDELRVTKLDTGSCHEEPSMLLGETSMFVRTSQEVGFYVPCNQQLSK